jgi:hypothetical protein
VQFADWCASVKGSNSAEHSVLQALQFQVMSVHRILSGETGLSRNLRNQSFVKCKFNVVLKCPLMNREALGVWTYT